MKKLLTVSVLTIGLLALFASCNKNNNDTNPNNNPTNNTNPYYFNFKIDGTAYHFDSKEYYKYPSNYAVEGYQMPDSTFYPTIHLAVLFNKTVTDSTVKALAGKTIHYDRTTNDGRPGLNFSPTPPYLGNPSQKGGNNYGSINPNDTAYGIKIASVKYLRTDTTVWN